MTCDKNGGFLVWEIPLIKSNLKSGTQCKTHSASVLYNFGAKIQQIFKRIPWKEFFCVNPVLICRNLAINLYFCSLKRKWVSMAQLNEFIKGRRPVTFIDLFAGAGGISEGFMQAYTDDKYYDFVLASALTIIASWRIEWDIIGRSIITYIVSFVLRLKYSNFYLFSNLWRVTKRIKIDGGSSATT